MDAVKRAPFSPVVTGAALFLLTRAPLDVRQTALRRLQDILSPTNINRLITSLKWLFGLGLVRNINSYFSELSLNNWRLTSTKSQWDWPSEIAVVTGASSGFGKLFSQDLALQGIRVAALDINDPPADLASNRRVTFFKCDVTDPDAVKRVGEQIREQLGKPSILINNAGIGRGAPMLNAKPQWLRKIFDVNLVSHYYLLQAFVPDMVRAKKGHVVSIASIASFIAVPGMVDYAATKAGLQAIHEGLTAELRYIYNAPQVHTTIVHPGWADTGIIAGHKDALKKGGATIMDPQIVSDAVVKQILSCRNGQLIVMEAGGLVSMLRGLPAWLSSIPQALVARGAGKAIKSDIPLN